MTETNEKLEFVQFHKPGLASGDYTISVTNTLVMTTLAKQQIDQKFEATRHFSVQGNRFSLSPSDIHSVYPPSGSFRDYHLVVPHIILNRSTLPWEREPDRDQKIEPGASWLALLLFDESETPEVEVVALSTLKEITLETGQSADDKITIIKVKKSLLEAIVPTYADLEFLSHIRLSKDGTKLIGEERATILCNRLPKAGFGATVHLVSLENRYSNNKFKFGNEKNLDNPNDPITTLVSLYSWRFKCAEDKGSYEAILKALKVGTLRLPKHDEPPQPEAEKFLRKGFVPLRHTLRMGQKTVSWYHGPLAPAKIDWPAPQLPAQSADELLHYNPDNGLFDVSYAAAWEHGRMLALKDPEFSMALFHLKKALLLKQKSYDRLKEWAFIMPSGAFKDSENNLLGKAQDILLHGTLSEGDDYGAYGIPAVVETFFDNLRLLKGVGLDYLIPHEDMLKSESINFFRVDPVWIDCLLDGAYSLGEDAERLESDKNPATTDAHAHDKEITGFLLRSEVFRGWPGLVINAYGDQLIDDGKLFDQDQTKAMLPLKVLRKESLSEEVLLMIFDGDLHTVDFSIAQDTLHFGLDKDGDAADGTGDSSDPITGKFWQVLRNEVGEEQNENDKMKIKSVPFRDGGGKLVLDIHELAETMKILTSLESFCSANFAMQMTEGAEKVRILRSKNNE